MSIYINGQPAKSQVSSQSPDKMKEKIIELQEKELSLKDKLMTYPSLKRVIGTDAQRKAIQKPIENMAFFIRS